MSATLAVYFVNETELEEIRKQWSYDWEWHSQHNHIFQGYIDDCVDEFVCVDEKEGLYRETVYSFVAMQRGKQLKQIDLEWCFAHCIFCDEFADDSHKQRWLNKFKNADQSLYLWTGAH